MSFSTHQKVPTHRILLCAEHLNEFSFTSTSGDYVSVCVSDKISFSVDIQFLRLQFGEVLRFWMKIFLVFCNVLI